MYQLTGMFVVVILCVTVAAIAGEEDNNTGAQYLQSAIKDLTRGKYRPNQRRRDDRLVATVPTPVTGTRFTGAVTVVTPVTMTVPSVLVQTGPVNRRVNHSPSVQFVDRDGGVPSTGSHTPPPLHLTRGELAAFYRAAVQRGETVKLDLDGGGDTSPVHAALHELDGGPSQLLAEHGDSGGGGSDSAASAGDQGGYYYYYYPLKSFMDELTSSEYPPEHQDVDNNHYDADTTKTHSHDNPHVYSHMHQHNVHIEPMHHHPLLATDSTSSGTDTKAIGHQPKGLEPLFMAISGFIGMTLMFILSVLVLPKFGVLKTKRAHHQTAADDQDELHRAQLSALFKLVWQAIEGRDCAERLACETGKAAHALHLYDNRFVKFVRRVGPASLSKHIEKVGKYTDKKFKCASIQCKRKSGPLKNVKNAKH